MTHVFDRGHSILIVPEYFIFVRKSQRRCLVLYYPPGSVAGFPDECAALPHLFYKGGSL